MRCTWCRWRAWRRAGGILHPHPRRPGAGGYAGGERHAGAAVCGFACPCATAGATGGKWGFPTINQVYPGGLLVPREGVYVSLRDAGGWHRAPGRHRPWQPPHGERRRGETSPARHSCPAFRAMYTARRRALCCAAIYGLRGNLTVWTACGRWCSRRPQQRWKAGRAHEGPTGPARKWGAGDLCTSGAPCAFWPWRARCGLFSAIRPSPRRCPAHKAGA